MTPLDAAKSFFKTIENHNTYKSYQIAVNLYVKNLVSMEMINNTSVVVFMYKHKDCSEQTKATRLSAIKTFLSYCWEQGWLGWNPALLFTKRSEKYNNCKNITEKELFSILTEREDIIGLRNNLIVKLIYYLGNVERVLHLKFKDKLPVRVRDLAKKYKELVLLKDDDYLFFSTKKNHSREKPLSRIFVSKMLEQLNVAAGFEKNYIDPESIVRLGAKRVYLETGCAQKVKKFCDHKSIGTTNYFLRSISFWK